MIPKKVKAPEGCNKFLTPGKEYETINPKIYLFRITDDDGDVLTCRLKNCTFLNGQDWIVTEWE